MKPEHMAMLGEAIGGLLVVPGMATSAYELLNGKTVSGEEANYFFAALGVPLATLLRERRTKPAVQLPAARAAMALQEKGKEKVLAGAASPEVK